MLEFIIIQRGQRVCTKIPVVGVFLFKVVFRLDIRVSIGKNKNKLFYKVYYLLPVKMLAEPNDKTLNFLHRLFSKDYTLKEYKKGGEKSKIC